MDDDRRLRVIAYDVADDRRRRRLEKLAGAFAVRVQDSVFEGRLSERQVAELLRRARPLVHSATDSLRVYSFCAECGPKATGLGQGTVTEPTTEDVIVG